MADSAILTTHSDGDEIRPVTALFADVVGSTSLGERLAPADAKALIGECVNRMCEAIETHGGFVRSYMGDGIAGFFGIDGAREDDVERAARAALDIRRLVADYSREVDEAWGVTDFSVRVGVNSGRVAVGVVGGRNPQRVAMGDPVNVAARLQARAEPGGIVIGPTVAEALAGRFLVTPLGSVEVRGRQSAISAFALEGEVDGLLLRRQMAPLIGRHLELEVLKAALSETADGRGQTLIVLGDAGLGKSRLVLEAHREAAGPVLWLSGSCDAMDDRLPYRPYVDALCEWLGLDRHASPIEMRVRLSAVGKELLGERYEDCVPFLARLLGVSLPSRLARLLDGLPHEDLHAGLVKAVGDWLSALAAETPVVFSIDNFCAAGEATAAITASLLPRLEKSAILLLLTARTEAPGPWEQFRARAMTEFRSRTREIQVEPLSYYESRELVGALSAGQYIDSRLLELVVNRAEGNPLFIEELLAMCCRPDAGTVEEARALPSALEGVLLTRIDALPGGARRLLQAAAVLGRTFVRDVLEETVGSGDASSELRVLLRADVIREAGRRPETYAFRHGLIREAALSTLTPSRARALNARAANALREWPLFDSGRDTAALVGHYVAAGKVVEAIDCLDRLSQQLSQVCRWDDAAELLEQCLTQSRASDDKEMFVRVARTLAELLTAQGRSEVALPWLDEALSMDSNGNGSILRLAKAECLSEGGAVNEALEMVDMVLDSSDDPETRVKALVLRGEIGVTSEDRRIVSDTVAELNNVEPPSTELAFRVESLVVAENAMSGRLAQAERAALRAQDLSERSGQVWLQLAAKRRLAIVCMLKGSFREATALTEDAYQQCASFGFVSTRLQTAIGLLHLYLQLGELEVASEVGGEALAGASSSVYRGLIAANLAAVECERGEFGVAEGMASLALSAAEGLPSWVKTTAWTVRALVGRARADEDAEHSALLAAYEHASSDGSQRGTAMCCVNLSESLLRRRKFDDARHWIERAREFRELDEVVDLCVRRVEACVTGVDDREVGIQQLERVLVEASGIGLRLEVARAEMALGELDPARRGESFARARRTFDACGCGFGLLELNDVARRLASAPAPV